jgi:exopolysaccharide biosynthesis protein
MKRAAILLAALLLVACRQPARDPSGSAVQTFRKPSAEFTDVPVPTMIPDATATEETVTLVSAGITPAPKQMPVPTAKPFSDKFPDEPVFGERSYQSSAMNVTVKTCTVRDTYAKIASYHVADIYVRDVTSIRTAAAGGDFGMRYEGPVKDIAKSVGALLAIDGDTYTRVKNSFVIRNGVLYRDTPIENTDLCVLYRDGRMETKAWGTFTAQEIIDADPWQVWGFGPALLDENGHAMEIEHTLSGHNPRAAIGYYEPGHYCFVIVDGRDHDWSEGMRLSALSRLMEDLGCKAAYNLDGGDSAQMYWNGGIISKSRNESRVISDIIYLLPEP